MQQRAAMYTTGTTQWVPLASYCPLASQLATLSSFRNIAKRIIHRKAREEGRHRGAHKKLYLALRCAVSVTQQYLTIRNYTTTEYSRVLHCTSPLLAADMLSHTRYCAHEYLYVRRICLVSKEKSEELGSATSATSR
eukprot:IDg17880t1